MIYMQRISKINYNEEISEQTEEECETNDKTEEKCEAIIPQQLSLNSLVFKMAEEIIKIVLSEDLKSDCCQKFIREWRLLWHHTDLYKTRQNKR